jgi:Beta-lactamase enzyme family
VTLAAGSLGAAACGGGESVQQPRVAGEDAQLIDWVATHPDQVSLLATGGGDTAGELDWNAERARPVASTFKILVLAAYAREVTAGRLDPGESLARADLELWYLEGTDEGAHERAMAAMSVPAGGKLSLDQVVRAMVEFSDNAATDYLLDRLGRQRVLETARLLDLDTLGTGVSPITGALLTLADDELGASPDERIDQLGSLTVEELASRAWRLAARYSHAPERSIAGLASARQELVDWNQALALTDALPWRGSARDLAKLVAEATSARALGGEAAEIMARHLSWPMRDQGIASRFEASGAKEGETAGVLALPGFARPRTGPWKGEARVVVLLIEGMDAAAWQAARETYLLFASDLAHRPDIVAIIRERLTR